MEKQPLLSVIVPVYNTSKLLPRCMESLRKQTYGNLEIILIDDGSTDESPAMCDTYAAQAENVKVLHKKNAGLGFARNSGLDMATGAYIAFLDSDDYIEETMYERLMAQTETAELDAVFCDFSIARRNGAIEPVDSGLKAGRYSGQALLLAILGAAPDTGRDFDFDMSVWKGVYARKLIEDHSIRFVSERRMLCEDLFFQIDFLQRAQQVGYIDEKLHFYCENNGSLTHRYIEDRLNKEKNMFREVCRLAGNVLDGENMLRWHRLFLGRIRSTIGQYVHYKQDMRFAARIKAIRQIAGDELVRTVIENYPIHKNPIKLRIFNLLLKWKWALGMYVLILLNR